MKLARSRSVSRRRKTAIAVVSLSLAAVAGLGAGAATAAPSTVGSATVSADTSDFEFRSFDADYTITRNEDGTSHLAVVETIVAVFPDFDQNRGIIRAIPDYYRLIPLNTQIESVVDERGADVYFETYASGEFIELWLGDDTFVQGATTYVITYSQSNIVGEFSDTANDEFYWDVNGTGWDQTFGEVSATVHVGAELTPALTGDAACYAGPMNGTTPCDSIERTDDVDTASATFTATHGFLDARETLTVAIGFEAGTFVQGVPVSEEDYPGYLPGEEPYEPVVYGEAPWWSNLLSGLIIAAAAGLSSLAIVLRVRGGDAKGRGIIIPQYSVPQDLNIMVAAHLIGRPQTGIPAQLVSLAVRHQIRILDYAVTDGSDADYTLQYLASADCDELEKKFLRALFGGKLEPGEVRELSDADIELGRAVTAVHTEARDAVWTTGLRAKGNAIGCLLPLAAMFLVVIAFVAMGAMAMALAISAWPFVGIGIAIVSMVVTLVTIKTTVLTPKGAETKEYLEGMKMYLELAEKERFRVLQGPDTAERIDVGDTKQIIKLYEKLLPFAVIWNVEKAWMKELEVKVAAEEVTPDWFVSTRGFSTDSFTSALRGVSTAATYTPPPPPSSSSWSGGSSFGSSFGGSSGGGFSGVGGGGGGGGGR